jgi:hypothetical protein
MARPRIKCRQCAQFHKNRCQLDVPECKGANSIAAEECSMFLSPSGIPAFLIEDDEQQQLALF